MYDDLLLKFLIFSPFFITSMSCLAKSDGKIRLAILYQAKTYRKNITHEIEGRDPRTNYFIVKLVVIEIQRIPNKPKCFIYVGWTS